MSRKIEFVLTILGDTAILSTAFFVSWQASDINFSSASWHAILANFVLIIYWLFFFQTSDLYISRFRLQIMDEIFRLVRALGLGMIIIVALAYLADIDFIKAKGFIPSYIIMLGALVLWRFLWRGLVGEYIKTRHKKAIIFQNGDTNIDYNRRALKKMTIQELNKSIPTEFLKNGGGDGLIIETNGQSQERILHTISDFAEKNFEIFVAPKFYPAVYQFFLVNKVADSPLLKIIFHPLSVWDRFLKRAVDVVLAIISLVIFAPLLAIIILFITIDSPGPVLYKQKRVGFRGRDFTLYKFRSMISDAERHTGPIWAAKDDKRITRVGRILRPLRLDELPQLLSVLKGDMSFVGPRPERPHFVQNLKREIPLYRLRLSVQPGVTGLAQVKHSYDQTLEDVKKKLTYDLEYINNMSLRLDLKIFLKTIRTVLKREGAH